MPPKKADWTDSFKKKQVGVSDMTLLSKVDNDAINENLEKRFFNGDIYTYIGHVLISVNPFKDLGLYSDEILKSYTGKNRIEMPPHVYAIAEGAYYNMVSYKENQCVIISGESGAGKTEAAKKIMQYIATVSGGKSDAIKQVKDMVLATNPLLESFGCAKTLRNNNSSRHGKYLEIQFNSHGEPTGAHITNYLLEKNRVVAQIKDERNFHIFYQFCLGASQEYKDLFGISGPESYWYTCQSGCLTVDGMDDIEEYHGTIEAMRVIGLSEDEQTNIHRVLASILWLGNVQFVEGDNNSCYISDSNVTDFVSYLVQSDGGTLEKTLTTRVMETKRGGRRGSIYDVPLNADQANSVRDAMAKALYDRLFDWIVDRVNLALKQKGNFDYIIGVLDIYGFEIFDHNSFEQLCINYVNEKLQQIFIELTLKSEQEEYVKEQIQWTPIKFFNNKIVCDLIEEKRPPGIFAAMNDACATAHADPSAADQSLVQRLGLCASNPHLEQRGQQFIIKHYAGDVKYEIRGMTDKNKDQLSKDILTLLKSSESDFIQQLFPDLLDQDSKRRPPTASDRIKTSAGALVTNLMKAQPSYIRCIKPNSSKSPKEYEKPMSLHQIKYLGLCENIRVRRAGFAYRQTFEKFVERFYLLSKKTSYAGEYTWRGDAKSGTETILRDINIPQEEWQLGVSKAFIRHPETLWSLESLRDKYWHNMAARIQRAWRRYLAYRNECAAKIQRCFRKNKDQIVQLHVRDSSHQMLSSRKERRRFSLLSMRRFYGDYLNVNSENVGSLFRSAAGFSAGEKAIFSSKVQLLVPRPLRSSKPSPRILLISGQNLYILATVVEKKMAQIKLERKVPLGSITKASLSTLRDDWVVIHVRDDIALVINTIFKTELCTHLKDTSNSRITIDVTSSIEYSKKSNKTGTLKFTKDEKEDKYDSYKNHTVSVGSGKSPDSVSEPPCARIEPPRKATTYSKPKPKPKAQVTHTHTTSQSSGRAPPPPPSAPVLPPPPPSNPLYKAIYDFVNEASPEGSFKQGDVFEITQKDDNGWWLGIKDGVQSWVPSNYLEELPRAQAPPPPPPATVRPAVSVATVVEQKVETYANEEEYHESELEPVSKPKPKPTPVSISKPKPAPRPIPKPRPYTGSNDSESNNVIPAWKAELAARQQQARDETDDDSPRGNLNGASNYQAPSIPNRPISYQKPNSASKPNPSIPPRPTPKPKPINPSSNGTGSVNSVSSLASLLSGQAAGHPRFPSRPQSQYQSEEAEVPVSNRPVIPARPSPTGSSKVKPPPRPPIPPRN
ncbi:hypothetical protein K502DRAFT_354867 [Neoconidiobolus thromboides FSU 785]|nr:hypothetical protein K502DRAFT_354867 [Neoconidiobolus thromboides FSU 785]